MGGGAECDEESINAIDVRGGREKQANAEASATDLGSTSPHFARIFLPAVIAPFVVPWSPERGSAAD
jgi:hypothetical protein